MGRSDPARAFTRTHTSCNLLGSNQNQKPSSLGFPQIARDRRHPVKNPFTSPDLTQTSRRCPVPLSPSLALLPTLAAAFPTPPHLTPLTWCRELSCLFSIRLKPQRAINPAKPWMRPLHVWRPKYRRLDTRRDRTPLRGRFTVL